MMETIRILIADDHPVVREGLQEFIDTEPGMQVIGEAGDGVEAVQKVRTLNPDVVLLDLLMPRKDGIQALVEIMRIKPEARVLVLTSYAEDERVFAATKAGALGYLLKDVSPRELIDAIRSVARGEVSLHPTVARKVLREFGRLSGAPQSIAPRQTSTESLSARELEVLGLMAQGLSNQEIADQLVISEKTVRCHVSSILSKLHVTSRTKATLYALREGLVQLKSA